MLESQLERRLSSVVKRPRRRRRTADGVQTLIEILNRSDRTTERSIFEGLEHHNEELADEVRSRMFVFEDIVTLDDRAVQLVLRQVEPKDLATALKGVRAEVKSEDHAQHLRARRREPRRRDRPAGLCQMKMVEEAQGGIVRVIRALEESGEVTVYSRQRRVRHLTSLHPLYLLRRTSALSTARHIDGTGMRRQRTQGTGPTDSGDPCPTHLPKRHRRQRPIEARCSTRDLVGRLDMARVHVAARARPGP